jgi:hypothetical protein
MMSTQTADYAARKGQPVPAGTNEILFAALHEFVVVPKAAIGRPVGPTEISARPVQKQFSDGPASAARAQQAMPVVGFLDARSPDAMGARKLRRFTS